VILTLQRAGILESVITPFDDPSFAGGVGTVAGNFFIDGVDTAQIDSFLYTIVR
jgi:hypothetical protein